ncbi:MAG: DNA replication/repair protein RecF [Flavobacteriales bacterium]
MRLQQLHLLHFRNHKSLDLAFGQQINCLLGPNGSGKTNVLDAIFYLCHTKSYLHANDALNIEHGEEEMFLRGQFERHDAREVVSCGVRKGVKKVFRLEDKPYERIADHVGRFPAVMIAPDDAALIHDGSERRRKWMDAVISSFDRRYLDNLMDYNRCLSQRNALLRYFAENRTWEESLLDPWDDRMATLGADIRSKRAAFLDDFTPRFAAIHADLANGLDEVGVADRTQLEADGRFILDQFRSTRDEDRRLRRTTRGVHKDDVDFLLQGRLLRKFGSQGQQKTFLIALRLAQLDYLESATGVKPILLLDDIFDKIDDERAQSLMKRLSEEDMGQVFLTDTSSTRMPDWLEPTGADVQVFICRNGQVEKQIPTEKTRR